MNRGEVVIVRFPFADGRKGKYRPALVVQNDVDNARLGNTIIAMVSGNVRNAYLNTQVLIDPGVPDGRASGVHGPSVVKATTLYTIEQRDVVRKIGRLASATMRNVDDALKSALGLT
jgi:mRNA interferase MazF